MMEGNATSANKSLSDSELYRVDSQRIVTVSRRTRSNSENCISVVQGALCLEAKNNDGNSAEKTASGHKSLESVCSSLRNLSIPRMKTVSDVNDKSGTSVDDVSNLHQQSSVTEEEMRSNPENKNSPQNEELVKRRSEDSHVLFTTAYSEDDDKRQENAADESSNLKTSSDEIPAKGLSLDEEQVVSSETARGEANVETSSPYRVFEQSKASTDCLGDNILGEPRCLALKKYTTDADDDFELDFEMTAVIEDGDDELLAEQALEMTKKKNNVGPDPNDMFLDDGTDIQNVPKADFGSHKKGAKNLEYPSLEKEEGELTPDLYSPTDVGKSKDTSSKKTTMKESNLEFFSKVNRCFRHLEKEFSNMHIPRRSTRLVEYLRNTLCVVERMKRKLSVLISSSTSSSGRDSHSKMLSSHRNKESAKGSNQSSRNSRSSKDKEHRGDNGAANSEGWYKAHYPKSSSNAHQKRLDHVKTSQTITKQKESKAKMEHLRRTPTSITYSKKERQRVQSLFKRQMDLITEQIKNHNDQGKAQATKSGGSGPKSMPRSRRNNQGRLSLQHLQTLDDMERFLHLLKLKKGQEITPSDWLQDYQTKQILKFTTKKKNPVPNTRTLPVLLTGAKEGARGVLAQEAKTDDIPLQENTREENVQNEKQAENPDKIRQQKRKPEKEGHELDGILDEQSEKCNSNNSLNAREFSKSNSSKRLSSREQKDGKDKIKSGKIDNVPKEPSVEGIEFRSGENAPSPKEVIDSSLVKRNSKEMGRCEPHFQSRASDFERDSRGIFPENPAKRRRKKNSEPKSSESDSDSRRDQILKKRKRNESEGDSRCKLSSREPKKDIISGRKSRKRYRSGSEAVIDGFDEKLPEELKTKNIFIVSDKNLPILDSHFCVKVKGNQIYLKKVGKSRSARRRHDRERRDSRLKSETVREEKQQEIIMDSELPSDSGPTLQELEDFLEQLRSKKIPKEKQHDTPLSSQQSREMKFMARIQAKRKAKLMACVSATPNITEKEAKFLKDLENRSKNPCDSPETESRKQKLMEKIRAETDNIVLSQKQSASQEDDPLNDVKTFLNMIKEAESTNDEKAKQFYVSFSLKRSDVKQLESITTGKASALSEDSQRFLNSVRAKMRAKKAPALLIAEDSKQTT